MKIICANCGFINETKNPVSVKGGKKSRRVLTTEQSKKMLEAKKLKKESK